MVSNSKAGRPRRSDLPRHPSGKLNYNHGTDAGPPSAFLLARRAALINPTAVQAVLDNADAIKQAARDKARERKETLSRPGEEEAVIDAMAECVGLNTDPHVTTALRRYYLEAGRAGGKHRLDIADYEAGVIYASVHGAVWSGIRDDIADGFAGETVGALNELGGITSQSRRLRTHLMRLTASALVADLDPRVERSPAEEQERRQRLWARYRGAREMLARLGRPLLLLVESLVIEDFDPWWLAPLAARSGEDVGERAARSKRRDLFVLHQRKQLKTGLEALAVFFDTKKEKRSAGASVGASVPPVTTSAGDVQGGRASERAPEPTLAPAEPEPRRATRPRMPVQFYPGSIDIDKGALAAAIDRLRPRALPLAA